VCRPPYLRSPRFPVFVAPRSGTRSDPYGTQPKINANEVIRVVADVVSFLPVPLHEATSFLELELGELDDQNAFFAARPMSTIRTDLAYTSKA